MTAERKFSFGFNPIPPVQSSSQKYFRSHLTQITHISFAIPSRTEGRFAIVTDVRRDAVDAGGALTKALILRTAKSCGPDAPTLASSSREASFLQVSWGDGGKQARSPGRARRKPLKPLRGECRAIRRDRGD